MKDKPRTLADGADTRRCHHGLITVTTLERESGKAVKAVYSATVTGKNLAGWQVNSAGDAVVQCHCVTVNPATAFLLITALGFAARAAERHNFKRASA
jgi:hypothetical protein